MTNADRVDEQQIEIGWPRKVEGGSPGLISSDLLIPPRHAIARPGRRAPPRGGCSYQHVHHGLQSQRPRGAEPPPGSGPAGRLHVSHAVGRMTSASQLERDGVADVT